MISSFPLCSIRMMSFDGDYEKYHFLEEKRAVNYVIRQVRHCIHSFYHSEPVEESFATLCEDITDHEQKADLFGDWSFWKWKNLCLPRILRI